MDADSNRVCVRVRANKVWLNGVVEPHATFECGGMGETEGTFDKLGNTDSVVTGKVVSRNTGIYRAGVQGVQG